MITPEQVELLAEPLLSLYGQLEADLLHNIAIKFQQGLPTVTDDFDWFASKLQEVGGLRRENLALIAKMSGKALKDVERIMREAGYRSLDLAESIYLDAQRAGLTIYQAMPLTASPVIQQILQATVDNAKSVLNLVNTTALESANTEFLKIVNQVYLETSVGIYSYEDSVWKATRELADQGITGITYATAAGKIIRRTPEVAVRQMILTTSAESAGKLQMARADEWGAELMEVSSHWGARPEHAEWQGKIYRVHGRDSKYQNLAEATGYGTGEGLCGYNCRHVMYPFWPGISEQRYHPYDLRENERRYNESQQQRAIERELRKQKRREVVAEAEGKETELRKAREKIAEKSREMRELIKRTGMVRQRARENIA